jgi:hemin uptake protein HemP
MTSAPPPHTVQPHVNEPQAVAVGMPPAHAENTLRIDSQQLFAGAHEVQIHHHGAIYRLKQTALGKLILTK